MNRRSLFRRLLAVCAAPLLKRLPGKAVEPPMPQWKNWTFKYEESVQAAHKRLLADADAAEEAFRSIDPCFVKGQAWIDVPT